MFDRRTTVCQRVRICAVLVLSVTLGTGPVLAAPAPELGEEGLMQRWKTFVEWAVELLDGKHDTSDDISTSTTPLEGDEGPGMTPDG